MTPPVILVFGALANRSVAHVCARLVERRQAVRLLHPRDYPSKFTLDWFPDGGSSDGGSALRTRDAVIPTAAIRSVYIHFPDLPDRQGSRWIAPGGADPAAVLTAWLDDLPSLVVDRPRASNTNASKPWQLETIAAHGFHVPASRVTTVPEEARAFVAQHGGAVIFKSVGDRRTIVQSVDDGDVRRLDALAACPVLFQARIVGTDVRVHRVGDDLVATKICFDGVDYRYPQAGEPRAEMRPFRLPPEIATRCMALADDLGLQFCGIDLRQQPNDGWACFEVNPAPGFVYYEVSSGQRIGEMLVNLLTGGSGSA